MSEDAEATGQDKPSPVLALDAKHLFGLADPAKVETGYFLVRMDVGNCALHLVFIAVVVVETGNALDYVPDVRPEPGRPGWTADVLKDELHAEIDNIMALQGMADASLLEHAGRIWFIHAHPYEA